MISHSEIKKVFSLIKHICSDAFGIDAQYFTPPYDMSEKIDQGFRRLIWNMKGYFSHMEETMTAAFANDYHFIVVYSSLEFYNIFVLIPSEGKMDMITLGPFRDQEMTNSKLYHIMQANHISTEYLQAARVFYFSMPVAEIQKVISTLRHILTFFLPDFENIMPESLDYSESQNIFTPSQENMQLFSYNQAERFSTCLDQYLTSLLDRNSEETVDMLNSFLRIVGYEQMNSPKEMKKTLNFLNSACFSRMCTLPIQQGYVMECYLSFDLQIGNTSDRKKLLKLPYNMSRKYSLLVKNRSLTDYSYLVRNIMNYVTMNIGEPMSLSIISSYLGKNPSYISSRFRKETGESLTEFIQKEKVRAAIRFFNTTNMSVAEVSENVGIQDFAYFSRIFKKHIGRSPTQYKRTMNTRNPS